MYAQTAMNAAMLSFIERRVQQSSIGINQGVRLMRKPYVDGRQIKLYRRDPLDQSKSTLAAEGRCIVSRIVQLRLAIPC
jgi:hypothetical protein